MEFRFVQRTDGILEASVGDDLLDHALNDAITSRAPRGAVRQGLSTYWIDRAEKELRRAIEHGRAERFASGNVTCFRLNDDQVIAVYDIDPDEYLSDGSSLPVGEFLALLGEWRQRVIDAGGAHGAEAALLEEPPKPPRGGGEV